MDSKIFIDKFISFVEGEPLLWNKRNELHGNPNAEKSAWEHIAAKLNESNEGGYLTVIYIYMISNNGFYAPMNCSDANTVLLLCWIGATGLSSIAVSCLISKDKQFRRNLIPIVIIAVYVGICMIFLLARGNSPRIMTRCSEDFPTIAIVFLGFPISVLLSMAYHFAKISNKSSLISGLKTISAAYFGSALMFIFFIAFINWTPGFFLFPVWMIVNGKFAIDALCLSWKKSNTEPKNRYTVFWNTATDKFEIVLNGSNPNLLSDVLVVTDVEAVSEKK